MRQKNCMLAIFPRPKNVFCDFSALFSAIFCGDFIGKACYFALCDLKKAAICLRFFRDAKMLACLGLLVMRQGT